MTGDVVESDSNIQQFDAVVVGSGPAGLMAADVLSGICRTAVVEKRPAAGWKLFVAGSSGLNVSNGLAFSSFVTHYSPSTLPWSDWLGAFPPERWIAFIENELGQKTFLGTSNRWFVANMHAAKLVRAWKSRLDARGVEWMFSRELLDFEEDKQGLRLSFSDGSVVCTRALILALGGGSWLKEEPKWTTLLKAKGLRIHPFAPANVGWGVAWKPEFLREVEGQPLKNVILSTSRGKRQGELVITRYGLEGTPVYTVGAVGLAHLDLLPDIDKGEVLRRIEQNCRKRGDSPLRSAKRVFALSPQIGALLYFHAQKQSDASSMADLLKAFPLELTGAQELGEAISSTGGLCTSEIKADFSLRSMSNVFACGEMLDWDAPTGGFLITGAVAQGFVAGRAAIARIENKTPTLGPAHA